MAKTALEKLMDYLARRDHSEKELIEKLGRDFSVEEIKAAIQTAKDNKWMIAPEELAEKVAETLHRKKKGYLYIQNYLREKGLPSVPKRFELEIEKALAILSGKFDLTEKLSWEEKEKAQRLLVNRGFDHDTIRKVLKGDI